MRLVIREVRSCESKQFRKEVIRKEECAHAGSNSHSSKITKRTCSNAAEYVIGEGIRWHRTLLRSFHEFNFVIHLVVKVTGDRRWMHRTHINAQILNLASESGSDVERQSTNMSVNANARKIEREDSVLATIPQCANNTQTATRMPWLTRKLMQMEWE